MIRPHPVILLSLALLALPSPARTDEAADPLANLRPGHPRLLATAGTWEDQIRLARSEPKLQRLTDLVLDQAAELQASPVVTREQRGRRILGISRNVLRRVLQLVTAYRLSGDRAHIRRAEQEMLAVAAFTDWNPSHFLDVAEMTTAVAIGYDEFFDELSPATRTTLKQAIITHGILPGIDVSAPHNRWHQVRHNWNQVCWGGLALGALAIADEEPALARRVLQAAQAHISKGLEPYVPDGLYPEGPGYWSYGTTFQVLLIDALRHSVGDDWAMAASPGFLATASAQAQLTGPTSMPFNFSDNGEYPQFDPALLWFARIPGQPGLLPPQRRNFTAWLQNDRALAGNRFTPLALLWWRPDPAVPTPLPLAWHSRGEQPVAVMRSDWDDANATYLATKGGSASLNHAHMDAGSFVLEADGVRWARDLGAQDYHTLEAQGIDLWNRTQESARWSVFRLNNRSHNTLVIDDRLHQVEGHATIEHMATEDAPFVILDLTPVYAGQVASARRGFRLYPSRQVLVRDELRGLRTGADVRWSLVTGADVTLAPDGRSARLDADGRFLQVTLLSPGDARFSTRSAEPPADSFNAPNPGRRILLLHATAPADRELSLDVLMTPGSVATPAADEQPPSPLSVW